MKKSKRYVIVVLLLLTCLLLPAQSFTVQAAGKTVSASISQNTVKIGKTITIASNQKNLSYTSSDTSIATVNDAGRITGKKIGTATITITKKGYAPKNFQITVTKNGQYPAIPVTLDEISATIDTTQKALKATISNHANEGAIRKIQYQYQAVIYQKVTTANTTSPGAIDSDSDTQWTTTKKTITVTAKKIAAGKSAKVTVKGNFGDPNQLELTLKSVKLYSGKLLLTYPMKKGTVSVKWGVKDTKAPAISGWIGTNSYNTKDVYMVVYPDKNYDFTKYVKAYDDRDGSVKIKVDTSAVNWKKNGTYTIVFRASDKAGNTAKKEARVQVRTVSSLDQMADSILKSLIQESWSDKAKAEAIYRYVRKNYTYVDSDDHASWENSALYGLRYKSGNCFVFYSVARLLLTRCGIPNIEVKRSAGSTHGHWWNYVYIQDGWYHFDTTPRRNIATFCLVTDAQLTAYSNAAGHSHIWNKSLIPAGAAKAISQIGWGKRY